MSKIDTQIRHITQPTDNIFADLGLEDAGNLKKEADALANAKLALTRVVADWVQENHFKQEEAAEIRFVDITKSIDIAASENLESFYLELVARAEFRKPKEKNQENNEDEEIED